MKKKSLNVKKKSLKSVTHFLKNKHIYSVYKIFERNLVKNEKYIVAVSGGPDSLALSFFAKCYSELNNTKFYYYLVDHKLRKESKEEANKTLSLLKKIGIKCKVLTWKGKKPKSNIQSIARLNRYSLLINKCKKKKSNSILLGHQKNDLNENFLIRMMRGSGLKGLVSMDIFSNNKNINFIRPLLEVEKKKLENISLMVFSDYVTDPSNKNENFKRIRVRNLISSLEKEGLDKDKIYLTIQNLKSANNALDFYSEKNIRENTFFNKKKNVTLNKQFFEQPYEIVIRSITKLIKKVGKNYYPPRGKSIKNIIVELKSTNNSKKATLGGCVFEKVSKTVIISKEKHNFLNKG